MIDEPPSPARLTLATLAATAAAPVPMAGLLFWDLPEPDLFVLLAVMLFGFPVALVHAALLGMPAYFLMRRRWPLRWWNAVPAGGVAGALPSYLLWRDEQTALMLMACGALGGLAFWLVARTPCPNAGADELHQTFT